MKVCKIHDNFCIFGSHLHVCGYNYTPYDIGCIMIQIVSLSVVRAQHVGYLTIQLYHWRGIVSLTVYIL
jgi:hypothetical protein